jgi:hypothetical protein
MMTQGPGCSQLLDKLAKPLTTRNDVLRVVSELGHLLAEQSLTASECVALRHSLIYRSDCTHLYDTIQPILCLLAAYELTRIDEERLLITADEYRVLGVLQVKALKIQNIETLIPDSYTLLQGLVDKGFIEITPNSPIPDPKRFYLLTYLGHLALNRRGLVHG